MSKRLYIETWGCQMNEYDSKRIAELLESTHQLKLTNSFEDADVLLMNTCSIREKAQEKVFSRLGQWRPLKEAAPHKVIGVGGCVASQEGTHIRKRAPYVDIVFGPQTLHRLPTLLNQVKRNNKPAIDVSFPQIEKFDCLPAPKSEGASALVSIQEGCNKYCTYCIVPYTRGEEINRPFDDVITEVALLAQQGTKEITLLGQNVNAYRGKMHDGHEADLALLISFIAEIENIELIRFTTSHPAEFSDSLINAFKTVPKLANHLHLPVQSGSDRILNLMGRAHTALEFKSIIRRLRQCRENLTVTSDFIVGYPGETEEDFEATLKLVEDINFDQSYSFMFSERPGTPAASLPNKVPLDVKKARLKHLQELLKTKAYAHNQRLTDTHQRVLVLGPSKRNPERLSARTECNRTVHFEGPASLAGKFVKMHITEAHRSSLSGSVIEDSFLTHC